MRTNQYDVVVIGAGSGGLTSAVGLSKIGKKVLLVEREHMGGECTNSGCIPSKTLLHHAKQYWHAKHLSGQTSLNEEFRKKALQVVRSKIAEILAEETPEYFKKQGIDVIIGEASFLSKNTVSVNNNTYQFKKAIIATGSSPRKLPIPGLNENDILTNQNLFALEEIPERTLIIGGGPIGMEIGQAFTMLGSHVTILDNAPRFASLEDENISPIIEKVFIDLGAKIFLNARIKQVKDKVAEVEIIETGNEASRLEYIPFDKVLVAIGRTPNLPTGLEEAEVAFNPSGINIDSNWRTTNKNIYALGDVAAKLKFTHVADDTARQVVAHILSKGLLPIKTKAVPKVTYTEPEMSQVGLSWLEAIAIYGEENIHRIEVPFSANDRAKTDETTTGLLIIFAKRLSGQILGANLIGPKAGEIVSIITLAIEQNISLYKLRSTIFAYPTYSLILKKAGDYFFAKQISSLKKDILNLTKQLAPKIFAAIIWVSALIWLYNFKNESGLSFIDIAVNIFTYITSTTFGPLLYILTYALRPLTFFPGTALTILSGIFFGLYGIIYTIIGANLSATLAYFVGRFFSRKNHSTKSFISNWIKPLNDRPFQAILTMRLTFFPFDLVAYGAGLLKVSYLPFILATLLGTLLGITTFVSIGASLSVEEFIKNGITKEAVNSTFIFISVTIFIASHLVAEIIKRRKTQTKLIV